VVGYQRPWRGLGITFAAFIEVGKTSSDSDRFTIREIGFTIASLICLMKRELSWSAPNLSTGAKNLKKL